MVVPDRALFAGVVLAGALSLPGAAHGHAIRPLFEPTDLEMEETGVVEVDLQFGGIRSQGPWRIVVPDFEVDVGLLRWLEFDVDGAYAIEGPSTGPFRFDHAAPDSLWPSFKLGLLDVHDEDTDQAWALGAQIGPKIPTAPGAHGLGVEGLALVGTSLGRLHAVLNLGAFADPAPDATSGRTVGIELGLDLEIELGKNKRYSLIGEFSGVRFLAEDPDQLLATAGLKWAALSSLDLTVVGMWGFLAGSDRYGLLLGISPKFHLF